MNRFTQYLLFHTASKVNMMSSFTHGVSKMCIISAILCKMKVEFQKMTIKHHKGCIKVVICVLFPRVLRSDVKFIRGTYHNFIKFIHFEVKQSSNAKAQCELEEAALLGQSGDTM